MTREEAIDLLNLYSIDELGEAKLDTWYHGIDEHMREALGMAIEALSEDRPTGEWVKYDSTYRTAICSQCEKVTMFEVWGDKVRPYDYCPNCGAMMMRGEEE